jgi:hypothetical protein
MKSQTPVKAINKHDVINKLRLAINLLNEDPDRHKDLAIKCIENTLKIIEESKEEK